MATIRKRGSGWQAIVRRKGYPAQSATHDTKFEAEEWARDIEARIRLGKHQRRARMTVRQALDRYLRDHSAYKKSAREEGYRIQYLREADFADLDLSEAKGSHFTAFKKGRLRAGAAEATVRLDLALISNMYTVARKEWGFEGLHNPISDVTLPRPQNERDRRLEPGEEEALLAVMDEDMTRLVIWLLETAMRRSEAAGLHDTHITGNVALLEDTKNGTSRRVPLSTRALAQIKGRKGKLFPYSPVTMSHKFKAACRAAGINDLRLHDLRHEATSRLFEKRFGIMEVAAITGHKDLKMLKRYTHLRAEDLAKRLG